MTTLIDQLGIIEAENGRLKAEVETLKSSRKKQAAVIDEYRARENYHLGLLAAKSELLGTYKNHFHTFHGSAESIIKQEREIDKAEKPEPTVAEIVNSPAHVATIKERIDRIFPRKEKEAAA